MVYHLVFLRIAHVLSHVEALFGLKNLAIIREILFARIDRPTVVIISSLLVFLIHLSRQFCPVALACVLEEGVLIFFDLVPDAVQFLKVVSCWGISPTHMNALSSRHPGLGYSKNCQHSKFLHFKIVST